MKEKKFIYEIKKKENLISLGKEIKKVHQIKMTMLLVNNFNELIEN